MEEKDAEADEARRVVEVEEKPLVAESVDSVGALRSQMHRPHRW